jgi:hypothetical protein
LGDCLLWAGFFIAEIEPMFGLRFSALNVVHYFRRKMGWATFWATFLTNSSGRPDGRDVLAIQSVAFVTKNLRFLASFKIQNFFFNVTSM